MKKEDTKMNRLKTKHRIIKSKLMTMPTSVFTSHYITSTRGKMISKQETKRLLEAGRRMFRRIHVVLIKPMLVEKMHWWCRNALASVFLLPFSVRNVLTPITPHGVHEN